MEWFWIVRLNGKVVGAVTEKSLTDEELVATLKEFAVSGPVERVFCKSITIGKRLI